MTKTTTRNICEMLMFTAIIAGIVLTAQVCGDYHAKVERIQFELKALELKALRGRD